MQKNLFWYFFQVLKKVKTCFSVKKLITAISVLTFCFFTVELKMSLSLELQKLIKGFNDSLSQRGVVAEVRECAMWNVAHVILQNRKPGFQFAFKVHV